MNKAVAVLVAAIGVAISGCGPDDSRKEAQQRELNPPTSEHTATPTAPVLAVESREQIRKELEKQALEKQESYNKGIAALLANAGYPKIEGPGYFSQCSGFVSKKPGIQSHRVCDEIRINDCPYAGSQFCTVDGEFVNDALRSASFKYQYGAFDGDALKQRFDAEYGNAEIEQKDTPGLLMKSWISTWKAAPDYEIKMMRFQGVNVSGQTYNTVTVMFIDKGLPDPF